MPSGSGSGIVFSRTFTPSSACRLIVTVTYDCQGASGDSWGSSYLSKTFCTQDGVTVYGESLPMTTSRLSQTARGVFDVVAGSSVECGLYGAISGAVTATWWNVNITDEQIKR